MLTLKQALTSSIGRKFIMAFSGLALVGFAVAHLAGNLFLLEPTGSLFNQYAKKLEDLGPLKIVAEIGLVILFGTHILMAITLKLNHRAARPQGYAVHSTKGGPSAWNFASVNMIITGGLLLAFLIIHLKQFTLGAGIESGYVTDINGVQARDVHKLVVETFQNPAWVAFYVGIMLMLGMHLRHGFWSMFQSLGALNPRLESPMRLLGLIVGLVIGFGFLILPLYIHFIVGGAR